MPLDKENYTYSYLQAENNVPLVTETDIQTLKNKIIDGNFNTIRTKSGINASLPLNATIGDLYYNTSLDSLEVYTSNGWQPLVTAAPTIGSISPLKVISIGTTITINGTNYVNGAIVNFVGVDSVKRPAGSVTWSSSQVLSATAPALPAAYKPYNVVVTNPNGLYVVSAQTIDSGVAPTFITPAGILGYIYDVSRSNVSFTVAATDADVQPVTYSIISGSLPAGLSLNASTGVIFGSTSAVATDTTTSFTVQTSDGVNSTSEVLSIIQKAPVVTTLSVSGSLQTFSIPTGLTQLSFKSWASGGAGGALATGGAGGYLAGTINLNPSTTSLNIYVPDGGKYLASGGTVSYTPGYYPTGTGAKYGPGYSQSGGGGGAAALIDSTNNIIYSITGAGGGGSGNFGNAADQKGGAGGGDIAQSGGGDKYGYGGTQSAGGRTAFNRSILSNIIYNPSFENTTSGWNSYLASAPTVVANGAVSAYAGRITWTSNVAGGIYTNTGNGYSGAYMTVLPNQTYNISLYYRKVTNNVPMFIGTEFVDNSGTNTGGTTVATFSTSDSVNWTRISTTFTTSSTQLNARLVIYKTGATGNTNDSVDIDGVQLTQGATLYDYFDGNYTNLISGTSDFENTTSGWGTSASIISAVTSTRVTGSYSLQVTGATGNNYAAAYQTLTAIPGTAYTFSAYLNAPTAFTPTGRFGVNIVWQNNGAYVSETNTFGPVPGASSNWSRYSTSGVCPAGANQALLRIFADTSSGTFTAIPTFYVDGVSFYYNTFDGYSSTNPFSWAGTANFSISNTLGGSESPGSQYVGGGGSNSYTNFTNGGGEGGNGYYGGAGGMSGGAGGGSSWINPTYLVSGTKISTTGNYAIAPNTGDSYYSAGIATGGAAQSTGGNGKIVLIY